MISRESVVSGNTPRDTIRKNDISYSTLSQN
jgi:hypothetical protein